MTHGPIVVRPLTSALGAEIEGVDLSRPLDNETAEAVHRAFLDHQVIFLRDQDITPDQHKDFARRFGPLNIHPYIEALDGHPEILEVLKDAGDSKNFGGLWHTDLTFLDIPPLGSMLYAKEVPDAGGDTMWANLYMAHERLSDGLKALLDGLVGLHSAGPVYGPGEVTDDRALGTTMKIDQTEAALVEVEHPIVRTHPETGRKGLFLGGRNFLRRFKDMTEAESAPLIDYLHDFAIRPEHTCRFRWAPGSFAFWDNRCTQHYALNDYNGERRLMHRVTIDGDRPV